MILLKRDSDLIAYSEAYPDFDQRSLHYIYLPGHFNCKTRKHWWKRNIGTSSNKDWMSSEVDQGENHSAALLWHEFWGMNE
jgi:hypothetical protein